jgi:hypothetical protein
MGRAPAAELGRPDLPQEGWGANFAPDLFFRSGARGKLPICGGGGE